VSPADSAPTRLRGLITKGTPHMTKNEIKSLMDLAAGDTGTPGAHWEAEGVERLQFGDPRDVNSSGLVEVQSGAMGYVRLELMVSPERAAEIIAIVIGAPRTNTADV
jgi:hypothetical protein